MTYVCSSSDCTSPDTPDAVYGKIPLLWAVENRVEGIEAAAEVGKCQPR